MSVTPETYDEMNRDYEDKGENFRVTVPDQKTIDKWQDESGTYINVPDEPPDLIAQHWEEYNMQLSKDQKRSIASLSIENLSKLLGAKVQYLDIIDSQGNKQKQIRFTYTDESV